MKFTVSGEPCGKARPRVVRNGNVSRTYTPEKTVNYENLVKLEFQRQCNNAYIGDGSIRMYIAARFSIPSSASKRKATAMLDGAIRPTRKPDCDNIAKIICDALNGVAYRDDAQIVFITVEKQYAAIPGVEIRIEEVLHESLCNPER